MQKRRIILRALSAFLADKLQVVEIGKLKKQIDITGWRRPIGCLLCIGHFPQKSPIINSSFAENDLQLKAPDESLPSSWNWEVEMSKWLEVGS